MAPPSPEALANHNCLQHNKINLTQAQPPPLLLTIPPTPRNLNPNSFCEKNKSQSHLRVQNDAAPLAEILSFVVSLSPLLLLA